MAKSVPYFAFYPCNWTHGVRHLSHAARSCFLDLLLWQFDNGAIPNSRRFRQQLWGVSDAIEAATWDEIRDKFDIVDDAGNLANPRMDRERETANERHETAIANGRLGAQKRWGDSDPIGDPIGDPNGPLDQQKSKNTKSAPPATRRRKKIVKTPLPDIPKRPADGDPIGDPNSNQNQNQNQNYKGAVAPRHGAAPAAGEQSAESTEKTVLIFQTVGTGPNTWNLTARQLKAWSGAYPGLDVAAECRKAWAWVDADGQRRKTAGGMRKFLVRWLNKATDQRRSGSRSSVGNHGKLDRTLDSARQFLRNTDPQ